MRVYLQHSTNLNYLSHPGGWTPGRQAAASFTSTRLAREECQSACLTQMRLVVSYFNQNDPYDILIPIDD